jgi:hypothetical protein
MSRVISIPTVSGVVSSEFTLTNTIGQSISPFSGKYRQQSYDYNFWSGNVTLAPQKRDTARSWQTFLSNLEGTTNYFRFGDPDGLTPLGDYTSSATFKNFKTATALNLTNQTLSIANNGTITGTGNLFSGLAIGEFITVTGFANATNNGTFKINGVNDANSIALTNGSFAAESSVSGCSVKQNCKGATALVLESTHNTSSGLPSVGDYLALFSFSSTTNPAADNKPRQLVMITSVPTVESTTPRKFHMEVRPALRQDFQTAGLLVGYANDASLSNRGLFRLVNNDVNWQANRNSVYTISFAFTEAIL